MNAKQKQRVRYESENGIYDNDKSIPNNMQIKRSFDDMMIFKENSTTRRTAPPTKSILRSYYELILVTI
jgi:hypothetical protein